MDEPTEPTPPPIARGKVAVKSQWMLPRLPVLIGIAGLGAVVTTGSWFKRQATLHERAEVQAIQAEIAGLKTHATQYLERIANLRWNASKMRAEADASAEPLKSWMRERANRFEALVAEIERNGQEAKFATIAAEIEDLCRRGKIDEARRSTMQLQAPVFPAPTEFRQIQEEVYAQPLANFSRQNPAYYRALQKSEPEVAKADIAKLRGQLAGLDLDNITPQALVMVELFSAVAPSDDPVLADWSAVASAADYFENADATTLKRWREAKQAMRLEDWPTAFARMQSITLSTVRTRQPFRAAYGRTILKNRPDEKGAGEAYPFMLEAAAAGDAEARRWIAEEDTSHGRHAEALRWLEAAVAAGDGSAVPQLLKLYSMDTGTLPRDLASEAGMLQRITVAPDAPPLAWMLLGRHYEEGGGVAREPEKAFACYLQAGSQQLAAAWMQTARCHLRGIGTAVDLNQARDWAVRAYVSGERAESVPMLIELMQRAPDRTAAAVQELFSHEQIAAPAGFNDAREYGPSVAKLRMQLAKFLDRKGAFGAAARLYAQSGDEDPTAAHRHAELTAVNPCGACAGAGKVQSSTECPTCVGKGTVTCSTCDGRGFNLLPGSPPCTTCGGAGGLVQDGRRVGCSVCGGNGKGKGSVIKQTCLMCAGGRAPCRECTGGRIKLTKDCPECRGVGSRSLADR